MYRKLGLAAAIAIVLAVAVFGVSATLDTKPAVLSPDDLLSLHQAVLGRDKVMLQIQALNIEKEMRSIELKSLQDELYRKHRQDQAVTAIDLKTGLFTPRPKK